MRRFEKKVLSPSAAVVALLVLPVAAVAAEKKEPSTGWSSRAELSLVATGGNTESQTASLRASSVRSWAASELTLEGGGLRAESTTEARTAIAQPGGGFRVQETSETRVTAESYFLRGRYRQEWSERMFWYVGAGWLRNEFKGIRNQYTGEGGVGTLWFDTERAKLRTDYGVTVTRQEDVVSRSGDAGETFVGLRASYLYERQLTGSTDLTSELIADQNLDETSDFRVDFTNSLAVSINEGLALRVALQLLYDGDPSLEEVPLVGLGSGSGTVLLPLDELDSIFTVALVIDF